MSSDFISTRSVYRMEAPFNRNGKHKRNIKKVLISRGYPGGDGGEIGGSRVYFPLCTGRTPSQSSEEQSEHPTVSQHI